MLTIGMARHKDKSLSLTNDNNKDVRETACEPRVIKKGKRLYMCAKCKTTCERRFNCSRHYDRFHSEIRRKTCCGAVFNTKHEHYEHLNNIHGKTKRYSMQWKKMNTESKFLSENEETAGPSTSTNKVLQQKQLKNHADMLDNSDTFDRTEEKGYRKKKIPKKNCSVLGSRNSGINYVLLQSIENFRINSRDINMSQDTVTMHSQKSRNAHAETDQENVQLYVCKIKSKSDISKALSLINF